MKKYRYNSDKKMIRRANQNDYREIYRLTQVLEGEALDEPGFQEVFDVCMEKDLFLVKEIDGQVHGFIHVAFTPQLARAGYIAEVQELIIDEAYRERSYGKSLLQEAKKFCEEKGISIIEVLSSDYRTRAHHFYESNGFVKSGYRFFNEKY